MKTKNRSDQFAPDRKGTEKTPIQQCQENTTALKTVNRKIQLLLDRIPLTDQREIVEINRLLDEQERLVRVRIRGHVPIRVETLNDNEKHRAAHLRRRFKDVSRRGKLKV